MNSLIIWITGASSGIGRAVALEMARRGHKLIISGRNETELNNIAAATDAHVLAFDVTNRLENLTAAKKIQEEFGRVDLVFLNAGNCEYVDVKNFDSNIFEKMIQTNFLSLVYGVEACLPLLRASDKPHLVGMSSSVAYLGLPRTEAYGSSKAAIRNFLQCLRIDLAKEKIPVSIVLPGFIKTPLTDRNDFPMPGIIDTTSAAKKIATGILKKREEILVPKLFTYTLKFISYLPSRWCTYLIKKITSSI